MDIDYNNYADFDEQEIRHQEEKQMKEIQDLIRNELDDVELEDDDEYENNVCDTVENENNTNVDKSLDEDDSRYEIENSNNDSNDKENNFLQPFNVINNFVPNYNINPLSHFYNYFPNNQYKFPQTNNNCNGLDESSINWEISLHDEMGVPVSENCNQGFPINRSTYLPLGKNESKPSQTCEAPTQRMKIITRDVAVECIPTNQRELDNLELLYSARGKRIEQLQLELDTERDKRLKETRILNHKVTLLESEQRNESNQLKRAYEELEQYRQTIGHKEDLISKQNTQITQLESDIDVLRDNLKSSNIVIEDLNGQLTDLSSSTAISRNNQKQADLFECINRQFDTDSYRLKIEIQRMTERLNEKTKEIEKLEALMDEQVENYRVQKHEWKTDYNRVRDELETEREIRKALENSTNQETMEKLHSQIADLNLSLSLVEDMNDYLREQLVELSQQLSIYEQSLSLLNINHASDDFLNLDGGYEKAKERIVVTGSCPNLSILSDTEKLSNKKHIDSTNISELRKQIFMLIARTTSLTNRLVDIRKINLDSKAGMKKLEKTIEEEKWSKQTLQTKFIELERRLKDLVNGEETDTEKQLKITIESLEVVKENLEQQCKILHNQLKQATDSMKESDSNYRQLEEEFAIYKEAAEVDKVECIEDVKKVCNNHYDNLREQLELSWKAEKEVLKEEENCHREVLLRELSDALKEIDRVKNLYIQLSQQKSDEQQDRNNWNEWVVKKLEDQKRSLNQQFQKDQKTILNEIEKKHHIALESLRAELVKSVSFDNKCEGTICPVLVSTGCSNDSCHKLEKSVQVEDMDKIQELLSTNESLRTALHLCQEECVRKTKKNGLCDIKLNVERVNVDPTPKIDCSTSPLSTVNQYLNNSSTKASETPVMPPCIIRSSTPQSFLPVNKTKQTSSDNLDLRTLQVRRSNMQQQFQMLKRDLISQLSGLSHPVQMDHVRKSHASTLPEEPWLAHSFPEPVLMDSIKDQLYNFVLEVQVRAAATLQSELEKSQKYVKRSVLDQLRQIIPVSLSVDGQLMDIPPSKIKTLISKVHLVLDHIEAASSPWPARNGVCNEPKVGALTSSTSSGQMFSITSTPLVSHRKMSQTTHMDPLNQVASNASVTSSIDSWNSSLRSHAGPHLNHQSETAWLDIQCIQLQNEIARLSSDLANTDLPH